MPRTLKPLLSLMLVPLVLATAGCGKPGPAGGENYQTISEDPNRDTAAAKARYAEALESFETGDLAGAERLLKAALAADLMFGPAHNNLGAVYLRQAKYYLAAWEFQYAAKLMPDQAEPRNNLGLVFETVGRLAEAAKWYDQALALAPESSDVVANLARVYIRTNRKDEKTRQLLAKIVLKDPRPEWVTWARGQLSRLGQPKCLPEITEPDGRE